MPPKIFRVASTQIYFQGGSLKKLGVILINQKKLGAHPESIPRIWVLSLLPHSTIIVGILPMMYLKDEYHAKEGQAWRHSVQIGSNIDRVSLL